MDSSEQKRRQAEILNAWSSSPVVQLLQAASELIAVVVAPEMVTDHGKRAALRKAQASILAVLREMN